MREDSRELIAAYHDGELGPDAAAAARRLIETDPEAQRYIETLRRADTLLQQAFDPIRERPTPPGIEDIIRRLDRRAGPTRWMPMAIAATVALVAVFVFRQEQVDRELDNRFAEMQREIVQLRNQTLENAPSGTSASWVTPTGGSRVDVMPVRTYRTSDNRYCREYEERISDDRGVEIRLGIACRVSKADWPTEPAFYPEAKAASAPSRF
jgi:surface antigen